MNRPSAPCYKVLCTTRLLRAAHRLLKVARTLADLEQVQGIDRHHLADALQFCPAAVG